MYQGDHLGDPNGDKLAYWRGPMLTVDETARGDEAKEAAAAVGKFQEAVRRSFTSTNLIREIIDREINTAVSRITWQTSPEQDALLKPWWGRRMSEVDRVVREALTAARREGRAALRFRVMADPGKNATPAEALKFIRLESVPAEQLRVYENTETLREWSAYAYRLNSLPAAEMSFVNEQGNTVLRVMRTKKDGTSVFENSEPLNLGGRLLHLELTIPALINDSILQNQMAYNSINTMLVRNTESAGFPERFGIGIEPPFVEEPDPQNPGQLRKRYLKVRVGNGTINFFSQATYQVPDKDVPGGWREQPMGSGQYGRHEPVSPDALTAAARYCKENIYGEAGQSFVLMGADASASGRSREVAMADFDTHRNLVEEAAKYLVQQVAETALALAYALSGKVQQVKTVEGQVKGRTLPQSEGERAADLADISAGVQTAEEVRLKRGYDEPIPADKLPVVTPLKPAVGGG